MSDRKSFENDPVIEVLKSAKKPLSHQEVAEALGWDNNEAVDGLLERMLAGAPITSSEASGWVYLPEMSDADMKSEEYLFEHQEPLEHKRSINKHTSQKATYYSDETLKSIEETRAYLKKLESKSIAEDLKSIFGTIAFVLLLLVWIAVTAYSPLCGGIIVFILLFMVGVGVASERR